MSVGMRWRTGLAVVLLAAAVTVHAGSYEDFFVAVENDDVPTVSALLRRGFDPNSRNPRGQVGLYLALQSDSPRVAELLAAHPQIDIDAANFDDETPLMIAALRGDYDWALRLLQRDARINRDGWTPLHYAAAGPNAKVVGLLLDEGAEIEARAPDGSTPLMMAALRGSERVVDLLLARGAATEPRDARGLRAVDRARGSGRDYLVKRLEPRR